MNKESDSEPVPGFASLGLVDGLVKAVTALGYEEPTPIQRHAIPALLKGHDLMGQAGTGTGKTAAFSLPMLHRLANEPESRGKAPRGFVLVPTRELAMQVAEAIHKYSKGVGLTVVPLYGGAPMEQQIRALHRGCDVVVATPGRALDHLRRGTLELWAIQVLVLDEADEMLDMGFAEDLDALIAGTPKERQTALFAATMAPRIGAIAERHLKEPTRVTIEREKRAPGKVPRVRQVAYIVARGQKPSALQRILEYEGPKSVIVFCRTRIEVDELTDTLNAHGYSAQSLHGGMEQRGRDRVMQSFRSEQVEILVATDVAARGLDIDHVSHVINYDVPSSPAVYVHRIGRTGRIGREGVAITLADPRESRYLRSIESLTKQQIDVVKLPTVRDLQARRLDNTRAKLRERLERGQLTEMRALVEALAQEFDIFDVAAAAAGLLHDESEPTRPEVEIVEPEYPPRAYPPRRFDGPRRPFPEPRGGRDADGPRGPNRPAGPIRPGGAPTGPGSKKDPSPGPYRGPLRDIDAPQKPFAGKGKPYPDKAKTYPDKGKPYKGGGKPYGEPSKPYKPTGKKYDPKKPDRSKEGGNSIPRSRPK
ncbi:MAG: DEAD/DEAH box helicase [Candidatus Eisenbacteria bacterium]|nr:DEAD/DEAH box helicase [Candidatus Eisenbacteria bacterium]